MRKVNTFENETAGLLMLVGQVADGIATPFIGIECDKKFEWWMCKYGRRKTWHLVGTLCVLIRCVLVIHLLTHSECDILKPNVACLSCSFPFVFHLCIFCENSPETSQIVYYSAFIIIFQFGWAAVQISHLSLIPDLTPISSERVELNALRYAVTVFANITVFVLMFIFLGSDTNSSGQINPKDALAFAQVAFLILGIGLVFSTIFHIGVRERPNASQLQHEQQQVAHSSNGNINASSSDNLAEKHTQMVWTHWFRESQFYKVCLLYMGTRLTINLTLVYIPNYLVDTLHLEKVRTGNYLTSSPLPNKHSFVCSKKSVAYIPLVVYVSGFVSSFVMKYINVKLGKRVRLLSVTFQESASHLSFRILPSAHLSHWCHLDAGLVRLYFFGRHESDLHQVWHFWCGNHSWHV